MSSLERKVLVPWILSALISSVVLTGIGAVVELVVRENVSFTVTGLIFGLFFVIGSSYAALRFRAWGFEMRDDYLYLEHGAFTKIRSKVPYVRVQHIDTQRGPVYRIFGLSKLVVYTAGSRGADVGIPGLLPGRADEIQERLRKVAATEDSGDAV